MLLRIAAGLRRVVKMFDEDPSLRDEPDGTGLDRGLALLHDLAHTAMRMIGMAQFSHSHTVGNSANQWAEAAAITDRIDDLAERVLDTLPRSDYDTVEGARWISRVRLAAAHDDLTTAADLIDAAAAAALRVVHPHSDAVELAALADQLRLRATSCQRS